MKKLCIAVAFALFISSVNSWALSPGVSSFLNNGTYLVITNNTTSYGTNCYMFYVPSQTNIWCVASNASTQAFVPAVVRSDVNGDLNPTLAISVTIGNTNQYALPGLNWNRMLTTTSAIPTALNAWDTNLVTMTFAKEADGVTPETTGTFTLAVSATGVTPKTVITNLPAFFIQGARRIWLKSITTSDASNTNGVVIDQIALCGWGS